MNWTFKIAAYLSRTPAFTLFPEEDANLARILIRLAVGENYSEKLLGEAEYVARIATGLDIPPFDKLLDAKCFLDNPVITHPLSGQEYALKLPSVINEENVSAHLRQTLSKVMSSVDGGDEKQRFFSLWRTFPGALQEEDPTGLKGLWDILPADPRIPSHTIWERAAVASAVAGAWPEPAFFIFTLASAQEMVETARRTQDAWMGSFLWSYLSWQAIRVVADMCGPDAVISPSLKGQPLVDLWLRNELKVPLAGSPVREDLEIGNIPNIFTAIVPASKAEELARKCEESVVKAWEQVAHAVKKSVEDSYKSQYREETTGWTNWNQIWQRQNAAFIRNQGVFWVICPWGDNYEKVLQAQKASSLVPSDFMRNLERIIAHIEKNGEKPHIGMVSHLLSSFAGMELTARKNLRNFSQTEEPGYKCSLCGNWEALSPATMSEEVPPYSDVRQFWEKLGDIDRGEQRTKLVGRIRRGDMLCSICLTRRLALEAFFEDELRLDHHLFPSTSGIATAAYRGRLLENAGESKELVAALKKYTELLKEFVKKNKLPYPSATTGYLRSRIKTTSWVQDFLEIDGDWILPESYETDPFRVNATIPDHGVSQCRNVAATLRKTAKKMGLGEPNGYYAILAMDGDHMGKWITGTGGYAPLYRWLLHPDYRENTVVTSNLPDLFSRPSSPAMQLALSDSLKNFSLNIARDIVERQYAGKLVYAGGDDLLAFLPIEHLFSVMRLLYREFRGASNGYSNTEKHGLLRMSGGVHQREARDFHHEGLTASMGAVILHHSYPLYHAMHLAQEVLKETAKMTLGRNAFAIRLLRRSGQPTEGGFHFNRGRESCSADVLELLEHILDFINRDKLSGRLPYTMSSHRWATSKKDGNIPAGDDDLADARRAELGRITPRHTSSRLSPEDRAEIRNKVLLLYDTLRGGGGNRLPHEICPWDMTSRLLLILRFMAGKEK